MIKLTFLGTGCMIPTIKRNHPSVLLTYRDENILFDCGESTQRQLKLAKVSAAKITRILISHWHGDHVLGLPGLFLTMGASNYNGTLQIYGPQGSKQFFENIINCYARQTEVKYEVHELKDGMFFEDRFFALEAISLSHGIPCLGYSFIEKDMRKINIDYIEKFGLKQHPILKKLQQGKDIEWKGKKIEVEKATTLKKGKKITYITDTNYCKNIITLAKDSDLLICESTTLEELKEKTEKYKHLTAKAAAGIAKEAKVKKLVLTHFSQRYRDAKPLVKEAKEIFKNTQAAEDFMALSL